MVSPSRLASLALPAALALSAGSAYALSVTAVSVTAVPAHSNGPCPAVIKFTAEK